jgi:hypothetical protein
MTWLSINPKTEREVVVETAMVFSDLYRHGWTEDGETLETYPLATDLSPQEVANLYNNAANSNVDIYVETAPWNHGIVFW